MKFSIVGRIALGLTLAGLPAMAVAQFGRFPDPAQVAAGHQIFTTNCSFCHGPDARGGNEGGPDLTKSSVINGDRTGQGLAAVLKTGRPPRMPAFQLSAAQITQLDAYLREQAMTAQRERAQQAILVGNATAGKAYFNGAGRCTQCHSVTGDLKGIASKLQPEELQGRMMLPRGSGGYPSSTVPGKPIGANDVYREAAVVLPSGQRFSGDILYLSDYAVTIMTKAGERRTFARHGNTPEVTVTDPLQAHLDALTKISTSEMHNLTAYLETLR